MNHIKDEFNNKDDEYLVFGFIRECESSLPSTAYYHIVRPIIMLTIDYFHDDPETEIKEMDKLKDRINQFWYTIDPNDNGDLDMAEFIVGLRTAKIQMQHSQAQQVFNLIDLDKSDYIGREQFTSFLMTRWHNNTLRKLQNVFFHKMQINLEPKRSLIWNPTDIEILLRDIEIQLNKSEDPQNWEQQIMTCLNELYQKLKWELDALNVKGQLDDYDDYCAKISVSDTLRQVLRQKRKDPDFGKFDDCLNWNKYEVASFLDEINFTYFGIQFLNNNIDGDLLLNDLDESILINEFKMSKIQAMKLLLGIEKLKNVDVDVEEQVEEETKDDLLDTSNLHGQMERMRTEMERLANEEMVKIERLNDLHESLVEKRKDSDFGQIDHCIKWNKYEVASFLEKTDFKDLVVPFMDKMVDGYFLFNNLNETMLINEFGSSKIQSLRLMKKIQKLKFNLEDDYQVINYNILGVAGVLVILYIVYSMNVSCYISVF